MSLEDNFPLVGATPYPHQREVFALIEQARIDKPDAKFIILRMPTGSGKSAIAMTLAGQAGETHLLASHRFLQQQYLADFSHMNLRNLWGRGHYTCQASANLMEIDRDAGDFYSCTNCIAYLPGRKVDPELDGKKFIAKHCSEKTPGDAMLCPYQMAKAEAAEADIALSNFNSFHAHFNYSGLFTKRPLMVIDEAHLLPDRLVSILEVPVQYLRRGKHPRLYPLPKQGDPPTSVVAWLERKLLPLVAKELGYDRTDIPPMDEGNALRRKTLVQEVRKQLYAAIQAAPTMATLSASIPTSGSEEEKTIKAAKLFLSLLALAPSYRAYPESWAVEQERNPDRVLFQPVRPGRLAHNILFNAADEVVLMSATLNKGPFLNDLGIREEEVRLFVDVPSLFSMKCRPLIYRPVGKMNRSQRDVTLPKMAKVIETLMTTEHAKHKGILHTHTFRNSADLKELLPKHLADRIIWHERGGAPVDMLIDQFFRSENSWLASPSCSEGLDGRDNRVRAQVIMKAPYPNLGATRVQARKALSDGNAWYGTQATNALIQAYGRGCRHRRDYCVTYVLDASVDYLVHSVRRNLPSWFLTAWAQRHPAKWVRRKAGVWTPRVTS